MLKSLNTYLFQPESFENLLHTAEIVVDTNVLLAAYQYRNITFRELIITLEKLHEQARLKVPSHVIKEFFKNRPERIVEIIQTVQQVRDGLPDIKKIESIEKKIPSMEYLSNHPEIHSIEEQIISLSNEYKIKVKDYRVKLTDLTDELKSFFINDPILDKYKKIFTEATFKPETLPDYEQMQTEFRSRALTNLPPGYKDGKKQENGEGDFIIWKHILEIKENDVIFITADNKTDWVYKESNGNVINARRELIEEFYEANERSFCIVHPSTFLKAFNPGIDTEVIEDMNTKLEETNHIHQNIMDLNDEGDSIRANKEYSRLFKLLLEKGKVTRYTLGTSLNLDQVLYSASIHKPFYNELLKKADKIACLDVPDSEKHKRYNELASYGYTLQPED